MHLLTATPVPLAAIVSISDIMKWFRRIFSINAIILICSFVFMAAGIGQVFQCFSKFSDLTKQQGMVAGKFLYTEPHGRRDSLNIIRLSLTNGQDYIVSRYAKKLDNLILVGDSIELYTKPVNGLFGNYITNGNWKVWNTRNEKEVFHLLSNRYEEPLVDFAENRQALIKMSWIFPFGSLLFFGWFLYRRSGKKHPLVLEGHMGTSS